MASAKLPDATAIDPAATTAALVAIADELTQVLKRETELVRAMRVKEIGALQADKTRMTARYQEAFKSLTTAHDGKSLPPVLKERLAVSGERLSQAVLENEMMLRVGKIATERLIGAIVDAVKKQKKGALAYAPQRVIPRHSFMTAAAVDRRL
jgi:hypothetical protein